MSTKTISELIEHLIIDQTIKNRPSASRTRARRVPYPLYCRKITTHDEFKCLKVLFNYAITQVVEPHQSSGDAEVMTWHDRLVAYVHAIDNPQDATSAVWVEHSYALCGRGGGCGAEAGSVRVLLGARVAAVDDELDVEGVPPSPPSPPTSAPASDDDRSDDDDGDDDEWEARLAALAPHAEHARLAALAVDCLRRVRLAKLAGGRFAERAGGRFAERLAIGEQAMRLRLALAPLWAGGDGGGAGVQRPVPWLHAALHAVAPRRARHTYERIAAELRRMVPRLADRLTGIRPPAATHAADSEYVSEVDPSRGPWLVWVETEGVGHVGAGRWARRWARRLGALVHTRVVRAGGAAAAPDAWCAAAAGAVRAAFADVLAEAGGRGVMVGGIGGGAALAGALAGGTGGCRGALLLAPALLTAEGPREGSGLLTRGPALVVAGGAAATSWRGALCEALGPRQRLLLLAGADDALRLPRALLRRKRLTQDALDAAVAEECVRWMHEACERADEPDDEPQPAQQAQGSAGAESSEEEYAHLPAARSPPASATAPAPAPAPAPLPVPPLAPIAPHAPHTTNTTGSETRSIEIVEGRVVSRVSGGTPLALMPPRRPEPRSEPRSEPRAERRTERRAERRAEPAPVPLAAADIMQLPIVFADDDRTIVPQPETGSVETPRPGPVTVTSGGRRRTGAGGSGGVRYAGGSGGVRYAGGSGGGSGGVRYAGGSGGGSGGVRYTRVIVAKRAGPPAPRPPLLVRRGLRLVPRSKHTN